MQAALFCSLPLLPLFSLFAQQVDSRMLKVPSGTDGTAEIPLTVIKGAAAGPTLALIAGNHGYEYPPILALQQLRQHIDPKRLSGTIYLVHVANMPSFLERTIYFSPADHKNLNRAYPGKADGTLSERTAYTLTREVIEKADYLLDLHAGDGNESLIPYVYQTVTADSKMNERIANLARAFGMDHILIDRNRPTDPAVSLYCSTTAITRGKPAITVESGYLGSTDQQSVQRIVRGVEGVLRHLKMTDGQPAYVAHPSAGNMWQRTL